MPLAIFLSVRKIYNLQMKSCLLLVLIAVIVGEILYAGYIYRTEMPLNEPEIRMTAIFSIPSISVAFLTLANN